MVNCYLTPMAIKISELIELVPPEVRIQVEQTERLAPPAIREAIKEHTKLLLKIPEERAGAKVPISIVPGHPAALDDVTFPDEFRRLLLLAKYRRALKQSVAGVDGLLSLRSELLEMPDAGIWTKTTEAELQSSHDWAAFLLHHLESHDPLRDILAVEDDILGVYHYDNPGLLFDDDKYINKAEIKIYWGVVGLVSQILDCTVEDLTIVVLTHELAHAYTQLGADIDGCRWPVKVFSEANIYLKEGLAQYYTDLALRSLEPKYPGALDAYEAMLPRQSGPYRIHQTWLENDPEAVRRAMIEVRRNKEGTLDDFNRRLDQAERDLAPE